MKRDERQEDYRFAQAWTDILLKGGGPAPNHERIDRSVKRRLLMISALLFTLMAMLMLRLVFMQAVNGADYRLQAQGNRVRLIVDYAPRGIITDRNGRVLADNSLTFQLSVVPYLTERDETARAEDLALVAGILGRAGGDIRELIERDGWESVLPLVLAERVEHEQALQLEARINELAGFSLDRVPSRVYDSSAALAHIVGYTGRVNEDDLAKDETNELLPSDIIGRAGIEAQYDSRLRGQNGWRQVEVDAYGRPVRLLAERTPTPGTDLSLTIDYETQKTMVNAMREQMDKAGSDRSAGVAVDPKTGDVIAMVSLPSYDNNLFVGKWDESAFAELISDPREPLYNKASAGGYTSGSIIKPLVAGAALQEGVVNEHTIIVDGGAISLPGGFVFRGWRPGGLGPMNVRSAIAWSSNIYFYTVGGGYGGIEGLGEERLTKYYRMYGLGEPSGIDLPEDIAGRVPDEAWKQANKGEPWYVGDSYNISIGQGDLLISPLQISMAHAAIANNGQLLTPRLVADGEPVQRREIAINKDYLQIVREGMRQVMTNGTTCDCLFAEVPAVVAGKSGTAETNTPDGRPPHAWFTAFAPYEDPQILATVLIEEGVGGSAFAAPAIAETMKTYFR